MVKVKVDFKTVEKNLKKRFKQFKKTELVKSGKIIRNQIVEDARDGVGYDGKDFPDIKIKTITRRIDLSTVNKTHTKYSPALSSATFSGDTIKSLKSFASKGKIIIKAVGNHKSMKGIRGKKLKGSDAPTSKILSGLEDRGWKILGVSKEAKVRVVKQFKQFLRRRKK